MIGVRVRPAHWARTLNQAGVTSVATPAGRGAAPGFHHVSSVELPPTRMVGEPFPPAASVCTSWAKIGFGRLPPT